MPAQGVENPPMSYEESVHEYELSRRTLIEHFDYEVAAFSIFDIQHSDYEYLNFRLLVETGMHLEPKTPGYSTLREWTSGLFSSTDGSLPDIDLSEELEGGAGYDNDLHRLADKLYGKVISEYPGRNVQIEITNGSCGVFKTYRPFLTP